MFRRSLIESPTIASLSIILILYNHNLSTYKLQYDVKLPRPEVRGLRLRKKVVSAIRETGLI